MASGISSRKIDEDWVENKLRSANDSMESVQTLSLWALNHKTEHEQIVDIWLKVFKSADENQMIVLIYLCNDVLQTCKRKNALMYKDSFKKALTEAVPLIKGEKAVASLKKILKVWSERNVFEGKYVEELNNLAFGNDGGKLKSSSNNKSAKSESTADMETDEQLPSNSYANSINDDSIYAEKKIKKNKKNINNNNKNDNKNKNFGYDDDDDDGDHDDNSGNVLARNNEVTPSDFNFNKLKKSISHEAKHNSKLNNSLNICAEYLINIDKITQESSTEEQKSYLVNKSEEINQVCHVYGLLTNHVREKEQLIVSLEVAEKFYREQNKEAKLVVLAYKNYSSRVQNLSKKLLERRQLLMLSEQSKDEEEDEDDDEAMAAIDGHSNNYDDEGQDKDVNEKDLGGSNFKNDGEKATTNVGIPDKDKNNLKDINSASLKNSTSSYADNTFYGGHGNDYESGVGHGDQKNKSTSHLLIINDDKNNNNDGGDDGNDYMDNDDDILFNQLFTGEMNDNNNDDDFKFATNERRDNEKKGGASVRRRSSLDERLKMIELGGFSSNFDEDVEPPPAKTSKLSATETISEQNVANEFNQNANLNRTTDSSNNNVVAKNVEFSDGRATPVLDEHSPTQLPLPSLAIMATTSSSSSSSLPPPSSSSLKSSSENKSHQSRLEELFINLTKASGKILKIKNKSSEDDVDSSRHRNRDKHQKSKDAKESKNPNDDDRDVYGGGDGGSGDYYHHRHHHHHRNEEKRESESRHRQRSSDPKYKEDEDVKSKLRNEGSTKHRDKYGDQSPSAKISNGKPIIPSQPQIPPTTTIAVADMNSSHSTMVTASSTTLPSYVYDYYTQQLPANATTANILGNQSIYQSINNSDGFSQIQNLPPDIDTSQYMYEEIVYLFAEEEDAIGQLQQLGQLPLQQQQQLFQVQGQAAGVSSSCGNLIMTSSSSADNLYGDRLMYPLVKSDSNIVLMGSNVQQPPQQQLTLGLTVQQQLTQQQQIHQQLFQHQQQPQLLQPQQQLQQYIPVNLPPLPTIQQQPQQHLQQQQQHLQQQQQHLIIQQPYSMQVPPPPLPQPTTTPQTHLPPPPFPFTQQPPPPLPQTLAPPPVYAPPHPQQQQPKEIAAPQQPVAYAYSNSITVISSPSTTFLQGNPIVKSGSRLGQGQDPVIKPGAIGVIKRPSALTTITLTDDDVIGDSVYGVGDIYGAVSDGGGYGKGKNVYCKAINPSIYSSCVYSSKSLNKSQSYNEINRLKTNQNSNIIQTLNNNNNNNNNTITTKTTSRQQQQLQHQPQQQPQQQQKQSQPQQQQQPQKQLQQQQPQKQLQHQQPQQQPQQQQQLHYVPYTKTPNLVLLSNSNFKSFSNNNNYKLFSNNSNNIITTTTTTATTTTSSSNVVSFTTSSIPMPSVIVVSTSAISAKIIPTVTLSTTAVASNNNVTQLNAYTAFPASSNSNSGNGSSIDSCKVQPLPDSSSTTPVLPTLPKIEQKSNPIPTQEPDSSGLADTNYNSSDSSDLEDFPEAVTFTAPLSMVTSGTALNSSRPTFMPKQVASVKNSGPQVSNQVGGSINARPTPPRLPLTFLNANNVNAIANRAMNILMRGGVRAPLLRGPPPPRFRPGMRLLPPPPSSQPIFPSYSLSTPSRRPRF